MRVFLLPAAACFSMAFHVACTSGQRGGATGAAAGAGIGALLLGNGNRTQGAFIGGASGGGGGGVVSGSGNDDGLEYFGPQ